MDGGDGCRGGSGELNRTSRLGDESWVGCSRCMVESQSAQALRERGNESGWDNDCVFGQGCRHGQELDNQTVGLLCDRAGPKGGSWVGGLMGQKDSAGSR